MNNKIFIVCILAIVFAFSLAIAEEKGSITSYTDKMSELEVDRLAEATGIPDKIDSGTVRKILSGEKKYALLAWNVSNNLTMDFPIKKIVDIAVAVGYLENGKWKEEVFPDAWPENDWLRTGLFIVLPLLFVIFSTIWLYDYQKNSKPMASFYAYLVVFFAVLKISSSFVIVVLFTAFVFQTIFWADRKKYAVLGIVDTVLLSLLSFLAFNEKSNNSFFHDYSWIIYTFCVYSLAAIIVLDIVLKKHNRRRNSLA